MLKMKQTSVFLLELSRIEAQSEQLLPEILKLNTDGRLEGVSLESDQGYMEENFLKFVRSAGEEMLDLSYKLHCSITTHLFNFSCVTAV